MESNVEKIISEKIKETLEKMTFEGAQIEISKNEEDVLVFNIKTDDSSFLIGQYGVNLQALQHVIRMVCKSSFPEKVNFVLDVDSYRKEKNNSIEIMARSAADEAVQEKKEIVLRPMTPYERRIVHMELSKNEDIKTESTGEGEGRRIIVKPL